MKEMVQTLVSWAKEDPKEFVLSVITITAVFTLFYVSIWVGAIIEGRV
jgi:methyl coenzyme M reductase alpha subunit